MTFPLLWRWWIETILQLIPSSQRTVIVSSIERNSSTNWQQHSKHNPNITGLRNSMNIISPVQSSITWKKLWKSPKPKHEIWFSLWYKPNYLSFSLLCCIFLFVVLLSFLSVLTQLLSGTSCLWNFKPHPLSGQLPIVANPLHTHESEPLVHYTLPPPLLGEHTDEVISFNESSFLFWCVGKFQFMDSHEFWSIQILTQYLGMTLETIARLRKEGVVGGVSTKSCTENEHTKQWTCTNHNDITLSWLRDIIDRCFKLHLCHFITYHNSINIYLLVNPLLFAIWKANCNNTYTHSTFTQLLFYTLIFLFLFFFLHIQQLFWKQLVFFGFALFWQNGNHCNFLNNTGSFSCSKWTIASTQYFTFKTSDFQQANWARKKRIERTDDNSKRLRNKTSTS